jgi:hypothetical protein
MHVTGTAYLAEVDLEQTAAEHPVHLFEPLLLLEEQLPELEVELAVGARGL